MKRNLIAGIFIVATAFIASSAVASGYGPAPFYRPDTDSTWPHHTHWGRSTASDTTTRDTGYGSDAGGTHMPVSQSGPTGSSPAEASSFPKQ
jgi:hypothetical protein